MKTKDRIIEESLTLFSTKGYAGVSVKEIADAVQIKDSSLYKHFKSKREIFHTIIEEMSLRMQLLQVKLDIPDASKEDTSWYYGKLSEDGLVELSKEAFLFYLKDSFAARFRRMLNMEQYRDPEISAKYREFFMEESLVYQSMIFEQLVRSGYFREGDPGVMAMSFYAPFFLLLNRYDKREEKEEEALAILEKSVREFARIYTKTE